MRVPVAYIRRPPPRSGLRHGIRVLPYLDDFAFFLDETLSSDDATIIKDSIHGVFRSLGLSVAPDKGQHAPTRFLRENLGYGIDSERGLFLLTAKRQKALVHRAHALLVRAAAQEGRVGTRELASFAGLAEASSLALPLARFMIRSLHDCIACRKGWNGTVVMSRQATTDLKWWARLHESPHVGRAIWRPPETRELWTDASTLGWGGALPPRMRTLPAHGFWTPSEVPWHITRKELAAVRLSVQHFLPLLAGHRVLLHEDNQAVVWILTYFTSRSPSLMAELRTLW